MMFLLNMTVSYVPCSLHTLAYTSTSKVQFVHNVCIDYFVFNKKDID